MFVNYQSHVSLSKHMSRIELVMFDFDGTLVDTAPDLIRATNLYLESKGFDPLPERRIRDDIGMGLRKLILDLFPGDVHDDQFKRQIEGEFLAIYEREFLTNPQLFPGAREFLTEWDGLIAIVSNKRRRFITPILEKLGLDHLPWVSVIGGDTCSHMKPHPEPFLMALNAAGVAPEAAMIVGDGTPDIEGAIGLGLTSVAVSHGYQSVQELISLGADYSIKDFFELLPLLHKIAKCVDALSFDF